jgi:prophage tail gpP-like protein
VTYEEYLDEVTTLITERFNVSDEEAIKQVMRVQADGFFSEHDDHPEMRTQERAEQDAKTVYEQAKKSGGSQAGRTKKAKR